MQTIRKVIDWCPLWFYGLKHLEIFIDTCPHFRTYFLYPVLFAFGNNKVYPIVIHFDMPVLIRCSIHENTSFSLIIALYKSFTQNAGFLCYRLCVPCVLYVCYASKFSTFYHNFRNHKENPWKYWTFKGSVKSLILLIIISCWTEEHDVLLWDRTKILLVPFFLDFSGFFELLPTGCPIP